MKKGIVFTIKTWDGIEKCYTKIDPNRNIETQIDDSLFDIGFCDYYEILNIEEVTLEYERKRIELIETLEKFDPYITEENDVLITLGTIEELEKEWKYLGGK